MSADYFKDFESNLNFYFSEKINEPLAKPHWVFISVSHKCNLSCQMCGVRKILKEHEMELPFIKSILNEVAGWQSDSVVLLTGGEPFLRKDIFEIIDHAVSTGLKTEVVSNGSLIDASMATRIMASGLKNIAISLDGATPATHDFIRGVKGAHEGAARALRYLSSEKKKVGSGPQISAWITIMKENVEELVDVIALAQELGVECLVYHPVVVCQDDMQNTIADGSFWITEKNYDILKRQIDGLVAYQKKSGLVAFLHDPYLWIDYFKGTLTKRHWKCNPFMFIDIGPDGEVRSCGPAFGNIKEMSLTACLETPQAMDARGRMSRCPKPCLQTCWANPDADSLDAIVDKFLLDVESGPLDKNARRHVVEKGIGLLDHFEKMIIRKNADG